MHRAANTKPPNLELTSPPALLSIYHKPQHSHTASPVVMAYAPISRSMAPPKARPAPPHYQTFLTPLLHRRFAYACCVSFAYCYLEAFLISDKSKCALSGGKGGGWRLTLVVFWVLFPLSWTGIKCLVLIFCTALPVLVLRISQLHGTRSATDGESDADGYSCQSCKPVTIPYVPESNRFIFNIHGYLRLRACFRSVYYSLPFEL